MIVTMSAPVHSGGLAAQGKEKAQQLPSTLVVVGESRRSEYGVVNEGRPATIFEAALDCATGAADRTHVLLLKWDGASYTSHTIDVHKMMTTGDSRANVSLAPLDIVGLPAKTGPKKLASTWDCFRCVFAMPGADTTKTAVLSHAEAVAHSKDEMKGSVEAKCFLARYHPDEAKRCSHVLALATTKEASVVPVLIECLQQGGTPGREAATALGILGTLAKGALPALRDAASSTDVQLRERAKAAIRAVAGEAPMPAGGAGTRQR